MRQYVTPVTSGLSHKSNIVGGDDSVIILIKCEEEYDVSTLIYNLSTWSACISKSKSPVKQRNVMENVHFLSKTYCLVVVLGCNADVLVATPVMP